MRDIAIIGFQQSQNKRSERLLNEAEMIAPVVGDLLKSLGMSRTDIDFTCSGSSDFLAGQPFSFVMALDALGAWPPINESHVEGEAAWAMYECWVKMQADEEIETCLVYGFGRLDQYHRDGSHVGLGKTRNILYSSNPAPKSPEQKSKAQRAARPTKPEKRWTVPAPIHARGMLLSGETLFVAGPPDVLEYAPERVTDPYHVNPNNTASQHAEALAGKKGARLMAVSATDGEVLSEIEMTSPPAWDGMAAANGRLYISTMDGRVVCLGAM